MSYDELVRNGMILCLILFFLLTGVGLSAMHSDDKAARRAGMVGLVLGIASWVAFAVFLLLLLGRPTFSLR